MRKFGTLIVLVMMFLLPQQIVAQSTEDKINIIGTGIGVIDKVIQNRREREKREKEIDRIVREEHKQAEEAAKERRMAAREAEKAHNNERIRKLNAEDDTNKQAFLDGRVSYSSYNNWTRNLEFLDGFCNKVTFFSEEGEPLVFRVGFDADYCLCLEVSSENGIIENEQRINLNNTRMEFYGSWKGDDYRFMTDDGSFTIPANTNVYKQRLSRIFPKYSSRLRSFEMVNANDLKRGDLNKVSIMFRGVDISTKVRKVFSKALFNNCYFDDKDHSVLSDYQETPVISTPIPVMDIPGRWGVFYTENYNEIKLWINNGHLYYYNNDNKERSMVCNKVVGWVKYYSDDVWVKYEDAFSIVLYPQITTMVDYNEIFPNSSIKGDIETIEIRFDDGVYIK